MSEKKTFKNQRVAWQYEPMMRKYGWCVEDEPCFFADEWDMEVTFTKKVKPIQINSVVEDMIGNTGRVVAVQADKAWVHYYLSDGGQAVDFNCVEWLSELANVS